MSTPRSSAACSKSSVRLASRSNTAIQNRLCSSVRSIVHGVDGKNGLEEGYFRGYEFERTTPSASAIITFT